MKSTDNSFDINPPSYDEQAHMMGDDRKSLSDFDIFCFNSKTGEIFGRTLGSWLKLLLYSVIYSGIVTFVFCISLLTFYQTLDSYTPKLQQDYSFIGDNPGLGFRPMSTDTISPYSSLINFIHGGAGNWQSYEENLKEFLKVYEPGYWANAGATQTKCHWTSGPRKQDEACEFNKEWLSNQGADIKCIEEEHFGYYHGKPCILVKLNRIYGWLPQPYYNITEVEERTPDMPESLKKHIRSVWEENCRGRGTEIENRCPQLSMVWLHCDGENDPDKENIGPVSYTPWHGFPAYYFPYWNQLGYLQPVIMVQLNNPTPGVLMNVECTAWAKGIEHDREKRRGSVHFEFLMD